MQSRLILDTKCGWLVRFSANNNAINQLHPANDSPKLRVLPPAAPDMRARVSASTVPKWICPGHSVREATFSS
ncbi:hypothetical protein VTK56DRAFT_3798 [Thermocarpiscus australiensis]